MPSTSTRPQELLIVVLLRRVGKSSASLDNHLGNALAAKRLASDEGLPLDAGKQVADASKQEEDGRGDQGAPPKRSADKLEDGHGEVCAGAHVVGRDLANKLIKLARGWTNAEEERDFDEEDKKGRGAKVHVSRVDGRRKHGKDLHGKSTKNDEANVKGEDGRDARSETEDHGQNAEPAGQKSATMALETCVCMCLPKQCVSIESRHRV